MQIAYITSIELRVDRNRHTVAQAEFGQSLEKMERSSIENNFQTALAETVEDCGKLLAEQIRQLYASVLRRLNLDPKDLVFEVGYSDVKDGLFWSRGMLSGNRFRVSDGAAVR